MKVLSLDLVKMIVKSISKKKKKKKKINKYNKNQPAQLQSLRNFNMKLYSDESFSSYYFETLYLSNPRM